MNCKKCGGKTTVIDTRTSQDLDSNTVRVRKVLLALDADVREHCKPGRAGFRVRLRHCPKCSSEFATVELTEKQFKEATK